MKTCTICGTAEAIAENRCANCRPDAAGPPERFLRPGDDLAQAVAEAPDGAVLQLLAGE